MAELAALLEEEATAEWQAGVLSDDNPAERAICSKGRDGKL